MVSHLKKQRHSNMDRQEEKKTWEEKETDFKQDAPKSFAQTFVEGVHNAADYMTGKSLEEKK